MKHRTDRAEPFHVAKTVVTPHTQRVDAPGSWPKLGVHLEMTGAMTTRTRKDRIELRASPAVRKLIDRAVKVSGSTLTDFAEASVTAAAQRILADQDRFVLSAKALH